jgi:hypothetical protein
MPAGDSIQVSCRFRPQVRKCTQLAPSILASAFLLQNRLELKHNGENIVEALGGKTIKLKKFDTFTFDNVFDINSTQVLLHNLAFYTDNLDGLS